MSALDSIDATTVNQTNLHSQRVYLSALIKIVVIEKNILAAHHTVNLPATFLYSMHVAVVADYDKENRNGYQIPFVSTMTRDWIMILHF